MEARARRNPVGDLLPECRRHPPQGRQEMIVTQLASDEAVARSQRAEHPVIHGRILILVVKECSSEVIAHRLRASEFSLLAFESAEWARLLAAL